MTQKQLGERLGLKQAAVGAYEEERATPPVSTLVELARILGVSLDNLVSRDLSQLPPKEWKAKSGGLGRDILAITVDSNNRENVELVTQKASAGYLSGYQDPEFVKDLPKISMPILPKNKTYRAFEIKGDSMLPIPPGTLVFGEFIEDLDAVKNGKLYVLVTRNDGIVFKRLFRFSESKDSILLVSDNREYEPYRIDAGDVLEIWAAAAFFSKDFPDNAATPPLADRLALQLMQLQSDKVKKKGRG